MGKDSKKEKVYIQLLHFAVEQKRTQHCKSTTLTPIKINFKKEDTINNCETNVIT